MRQILRLAIVVLLLTLAACGRAPTDVASQTPEPYPPPATATAAPTQPPAPTATLVPSATSAPTSEPTSAPTATAEPTQAPTATQAPAATPGTTPDGLAIRPDLPGKLAFVRDGNIFAYTPATGDLAVVIEGGRDPQFSRDGSQLAFVRDDGLYLAAADGSNARRIAQGSNIRGPRWTDDGSRIAYESIVDPMLNRGEIYAIELPDGAPVKVGDGADPAWDHTGRRIAYVTAIPEDTGGPRRNQLRLVNWRGENGWTVVSTLPSGTPPVGIPGGEMPPADLDHLMYTPLWSADGAAIYVPSFVLYQVLTDFTMLERADATNGGSTLVEQGPLTFGEATGAPDRAAAVFQVGSARGDVQIKARALDPGADDSAFAWAETDEVAVHAAPAWSPGGDALAVFRCGMEPSGACDLVLLTPDAADPVVLIPAAVSTQGPGANDLFLSWGP
jgi:hypothetical protein